MTRRWELDLLRGIMLILMFITHLPTRFSSPLGQPFGYVSAAEGFVMLSAFMAGLIYTGNAERNGIGAMRKAFFARAVKIYTCHAGLLIFLFSVIAWLGIARDQPALTNLLGFYLNHPHAGLWGGLLLIYNPPLLDILPLYIMLMLVSPLILGSGLLHGWRNVFAVSATLWFTAQFGISEWLYAHFVNLTDLQVPYKETGSFDSYAWQFLWVFGLWMGALTQQGMLAKRKPFPKWLIAAAATYALACWIWRYAVGQVPVPYESPVNLLFDKWQLGPLRLLDFFALLILVMHYAGWLKAHVPRIGFLEKMGAASLPVFCVHLVLVLFTLAIFGPADPHRPLWKDAILFGGGLAVLYATALITLRLDREEHARAVAERKMRQALAQTGKT